MMPTDTGGPSHFTAEAQRLRRRRRRARWITGGVGVVVASAGIGFAVARMPDEKPAARTATTRPAISSWTREAQSILRTIARDRMEILEWQMSSDPSAVENVHVACGSWAEDATSLSTTTPSGDAQLDELIGQYYAAVNTTVAMCLADESGSAPEAHERADTIKTQIITRAAMLDARFTQSPS
jgi:hypothetical protein